MSTKEKILDAALTLFAENGYSDMAVCMDGGYLFCQNHQHHIRVCHAEEICCSTYDYEQGDRRAAFHASAHINNSSA